jgi:hypothetical protein
MFIVDLAGSERARRTGSALNTVQQREAAQINASLMNLMQCIQQLNSNQQRPNSAGAGVVPFRGSKLSHLFMNHLTGASNGKTVMIVNVNPSAADFDETQHVLSYAVVAKNVKIDAAEYNKKVSVMSSFQGGSLKACYDSDKEGCGRRKRNADRSKENSASRKLAKIAAGSLKFSPKVLAKKSNKFMKQDTSGKHQTLGPFSTNFEKYSKPLDGSGEQNSFPNQDAFVQEVEIKKISTIEHENRILLEEVETLKGKIMSLQNEVCFLKDELVNKESEIRAEVGDEFESQISKIREQYEIIRKHQEKQDKDSHTSILIQSTKKIQQDKAEDFVDDLIDKIEECEEELQRLRSTHQEELDRLRKTHKKDIKSKDVEIEHLQHLHQVILASKDAEIEKLTLDLRLLSNGISDDLNSSAGCDVTKSIEREMNNSCELEGCQTGISVDSSVTKCKANTDFFCLIKSPFDEELKNENVFDDKSAVDRETFTAPKDEVDHDPVHSKENMPDNNDSECRLRLLRQGRCSEVACEPVLKSYFNGLEGPSSGIANPPLLGQEGESEDDRQEMTLRMRLRSRKVNR